MDAALERRVRDLHRRLAEADTQRQAGSWSDALAGYLALQADLPAFPPLHHHIALCHFALGALDLALESAIRAASLDPALWQARLVQAKALRSLGRAEEALAALDEVGEKNVEPVRAERASLLLHEFGDAAGAAATAAGPASLEGIAELQGLVALLYDPGRKTAEEVNAAFLEYSQRMFPARFRAHAEAAASAPRARPRVGVVSPQFFASPVYFFSIGALRLMSQEVDLVFFHRGTREDWATTAFKEIAREWHDVSSLDAERLEPAMRAHTLDALIDLGGWMDPQCLRALAGKPARRMFKWVGGQSLSTGLRSFDGFIGDLHQSPRASQVYYAEPLTLIPNGYVTYTPPAYMPEAGNADGPGVCGVISNPLKLSAGFLAMLSDLIHAPALEGRLTELRLIDARYKHAALRNRMASVLGVGNSAVKVKFFSPENHLAYLREVGRLGVVIDTFPYSGGLTTMEALWMGVPSLTRKGELFCERHTYAHCRYAGMKEDAFLLGGADSLARALARTGTSRRRLLPEGSPRLDHGKLAHSLLQLVSS